jgi:pimeloyl-ACP methyl ester carboxylesterase
MKAFAQGSVTANSIQIHYYRYTKPGSASRAVVFLHGVTDNGLCWSRVAQALPDSYDLVLMDARAHGRSDAPVSGYSADDRACDVAGLINALGLDRPVLVGHSMGAETALATAAIYPALVQAVVMEDPPWPGRFYGSTPEERTERAAHWREEILQQKALSRDELIAQGRLNNPTWAEEELFAWADAKKEIDPNLVGIVTAPRRRWSDYARQAECPLLLVTADPERGAIVSPRTVEEAALVWKKGRAVHIAGAGHSIHREQFDAYLQALQTFLDEVFDSNAPR